MWTLLPRVSRQAVVVAALLALLGLPASLFAQATNDVPEVTRTFALVNARVVQAPGRILDRATVVVRDGLILAVGRNASIPFDAERIAADSLVVYAGFIDGLSHAGIPEPREDRNQERPDVPGDPPDEYAGIQPHRDARMLLDPSEPSLKKLRDAGFTVAHVVPHGRMLPGSGAVILLTDGEDSNALVLKGDASIFAQFAGARRAYPATDMAVMAKLRQIYREAERRQRMEALYAENPTGLERPAYDPVHYAFFPVLDGEKSLYFHTENALDVYRALDLRERLGLPLVLTGLNQGFDAVEALKEAGLPLFLTLDLPEAPKKSNGDKPPADSTASEQNTDAGNDLPQAQVPDYNPDLRTRTYRDVEAEAKNLEARQQMALETYYATASTLSDAGLSFGFTTMDAKPEDVMKNVRTMIEHGLSEDAALAALTTTPAEILGIQASTGTIEPGKMANLVVANGPIFDEKTKIRYVFVDGRKFEMEDRPQPGEGSGEPVNPAGTWNYTVTTPEGEVDGTLTFTGSPGSLSGTLTSAMTPDTIALEEISVSGNILSFAFNVPGMGRMTAEITISGDTLEGSISSTEFGGIPLTGTRTSGPDF